VTVVIADATRPAVQDATAAVRATRLICALPHDADNLRLATAADAANHAQSVFAQIEDPDLAELAAASGVECFDLNDIWARNLLGAGPLARPGQAATPHIVIVGDGALAEALIVNAARSWHFFVRELGSGDRLTITAVAVGADALSTSLQ